MSSTAKASIVIGGNTKELEAAVDRAMSKLTGMAVTVGGLFAGAATFAWGYDLLKQSEAAEIGFTQMLGSADLAKQTLKELADYAAKTPFDNPTLVKAYRNLLNFKFAAQDAPGILRILGDAAAAMPEGMSEGMSKLTIIMGQMKSKAKLSSQEMMQLTEAGINSWSYLQKELKVSSVAEAVAKVEAGAVDSATGVRAVLKGMEADFGGIGAKMSKTVEGLMSTITDNAGRGLQAIFKGATGGDFKTWLDQFGEGLNTLGSTGEAIGERIAQGFQVVKNVFDGIWAVGSAIGEVLSSAFGEAGVEDFGAQLASVRTDFELVKQIAMKFIEVISIGFAMAGDAINNFLVEPIKIFVGYIVQFVSRIMELVATLLDGLGYVSDTAADMAKSMHESASSVNKWGEDLADKGRRGMDSGPVAANAVREFFAKIDAKPVVAPMSSSAAADEASAKWGDMLDDAAGKLLDFTKKVDDMASIAPIVGAEMTKLAQEAAQARLMESQKVMRGAKSPGDIFREELSDLSRMFQEGLINKDALAAAVGEKSRGLAGSLPGYTANTGIMAGSSEAQSAIIAARQGGGAKIEDILKSVDREATITRKLNEDILKQLQKSKLVPVGVS